MRVKGGVGQGQPEREMAGAVVTRHCSGVLSLLGGAYQPGLTYLPTALPASLPHPQQTKDAENIT